MRWHPVLEVSRRNVVLLAVPLVLVLLLEICQLVLPGLAERRIRDRLGPSARDAYVSVSAWPAVELLWGDADRVAVRMDSYASGSSSLGSLLDQTAAVDHVDARVGVLRTGLLVLHDATLVKRGARLSASATVFGSDLRRAVPILQSVSASSAAGALRLSGSVSALGVDVAGSALVNVVDGAIELTPELPFGGLATLRLFSDPRLRVTGLAVRGVAGGFSLSASGLLAGS